MDTKDQNAINENQLWQLLELVASPDADIDTDSLAEVLEMAVNGDGETKIAGIRKIHEQLDNNLPG